MEGLPEIAAFLDANPRVFLWTTLQSYVSGEDAVDAFREAGLDELAWSQPPGEPWPLMGEALDAGYQVAIFSAEGGGAADWYMPQWEHWVDNPYHYESVEEFSCEAHRGLEENALLNMNHFLTAPLASRSLAAEANQREVLQAHVEDCARVFGRQPAQILVDFYDEGALMDVVASLNLGL